MSDKNNDYGYGYAPPTPTSPEDEFFHSVYIGGIERTNHINVVEQAGKLHVRGVKYNLDEVCMIITHVKPVLIKRVKQNNKEKTVCFSYQNSNPWKGSNGNICPTNRNDREATPACSGCRGEVIISGIFCEKNGKPILSEDKKPIFIFIRGKGMKSFNVYKYLDKIAKIDLPPIFPDNPSLEKRVVKNKRYVTIITKTTAKSDYGVKNVFKLDFGTKIDDKFIQKILKIQKETIPQFNDKFDWSVNLNTDDTSFDEASSEDGYQDDHKAQQEDTQEQIQVQETVKESPKSAEKKDSNDSYDFDIPF